MATSPGDRARGALLGQLIGDALGTTVEFQDAAAVRASHPDGLRELIGGGPFGLPPGQVTDDSELALALARSIVDGGGYDADRAAAAYVAWLASAPFDVGNTCRQAFSADPEPLAGLAARVAARASQDSQANGALMRVSPLGIYGAGLEPERIAELAEADARLSHPHEICRHSSVLFAQSLAAVIRDGLDGRGIYDVSLDLATGGMLSEDVMDVLFAAPQAASDDFQTHMGHVIIALQNAFHQALCADSFEDGLVATVMHGGDADTNGCIAGALLGAIHGESGIPKRWVDTVLGCTTERGPVYQTSDARELADALLALGRGARG